MQLKERFTQTTPEVILALVSLHVYWLYLFILLQSPPAIDQPQTFLDHLADQNLTHLLLPNTDFGDRDTCLAALRDTVFHSYDSNWLTNLSEQNAVDWVNYVQGVMVELGLGTMTWQITNLQPQNPMTTYFGIAAHVDSTHQVYVPREQVDPAIQPQSQLVQFLATLAHEGSHLSSQQLVAIEAMYSQWSNTSSEQELLLKATVETTAQIISLETLAYIAQTETDPQLARWAELAFYWRLLRIIEMANDLAPNSQKDGEISDQSWQRVSIEPDTRSGSLWAYGQLPLQFVLEVIPNPHTEYHFDASEWFGPMSEIAFGDHTEFKFRYTQQLLTESTLVAEACQVVS